MAIILSGETEDRAGWSELAGSPQDTKPFHRALLPAYLSPILEKEDIVAMAYQSPNTCPEHFSVSFLFPLNPQALHDHKLSLGHALGKKKNVPGSAWCYKARTFWR